MQTRNLLQSPAVACFALVSICFLFVNGIIPAERSKPILNTFESYFKGNNNTIYKIVRVEEIKEALAKAKGKKIIMNIYPVKLSQDAKKTDFALRVFFQDTEGSKQNLGEEIDSGLFKTQSTYYISFLKSKNISGNNIPHGYFIEIDNNFVEKIDAVSLSLAVEKSQLEYYLLAATAAQKTDSTKKEQVVQYSDSTCKCPPECCSLSILSMDSTGKCPPECPRISMLFSNTMGKVISHVYKKRTVYRLNKK